MSGADAVAVSVNAASAPTSAPDPAPRLGFVARVVDRLSPILVREVQQTLNGRAFLATLAVSLLGVVIVGLTASGGVSRGHSGFETFRLALQLMAPLVIVAVPLLAFLSMRQEVTAGTIEHLLLSKLGPGAIVRGKLYAALVQLVLFLGVFAPLIGMTYLLRGVDVPTILQMLGLAGLAGLVACSFAIAMGALSRWNAVRALPLLVTAAGLTILCTTVVGGMGSILTSVSFAVSRSEAGRDSFTPLATAWLPSAVAVLLFGVTAAAALAHPNENRSSVFRVFAVAALLAMFGVDLWMDARWRSSAMAKGFGRTSLLPEAVPESASVAAAILFLFWYFAVTEAPSFSLRVRTRVPRNRVLAGFFVPWLPGGARGYLATLLLASIAIVGAVSIPRWAAGADPRWPQTWTTFGVWGYTMAYAGLFAFVRRRMPPTSRATVALRLLGIPGMVLLSMIPRLVDLVLDVRIHTYSPLDLVDPISTLDVIRRNSQPTALPILLGAVAVGFVLALPSIFRGFGEVFDASRERRSRAR